MTIRPNQIAAWGLLAVVGLLMGNGYSAGDHAAFHELLGKYVRENGVRYAQWADDQENESVLHKYVEALEAIDPRRLSRDDQFAYWINLYNATTLRLILDHYPVASIRDLSGEYESPWKRPLVVVSGNPLTLDAIENEIIRPRFDDPRVHFALNCAAVSCPPLAPFAFTGDELDTQLDLVTAAAVRDPRFVQVDCDNDRTIRLSPLFQWYESDWKETGVRGFIARYLPDRAGAVTDSDCPLSYREYDWALNEAHD